MQYQIDNINYDVVIIKKNNKNLYIRIKDDKKIYVTCNYLTSKYEIKKVLDSNINSLRKMLKNVELAQEKSNKFFYLGKSYDIIIDEDTNKINIVGDSIITRDLKMLSKWYKDETIRIFDERYVYIFNHFKENIKSPILKIRNMKSRWGVYNRINQTITLN